VTGQQRMLTPPRHVILPLHFSGGPCCPALDLVFNFWTLIMFYTLLTFPFCTIDIFKYILESSTPIPNFVKIGYDLKKVKTLFD
jgi:hypothetical protein